MADDEEPDPRPAAVRTRTEHARAAFLDNPIDPGAFLEKRSYRRRRLMDGLRLVPVLGVWLFMVPLFWPANSHVAANDGVSMSRALVYIFVVWCGLTVTCAVLIFLRRRAAAGGDIEEDSLTGKL